MGKFLEYFKLGVLLDINSKLPYQKENTYDDDNLIEYCDNVDKERANYNSKLLEIEKIKNSRIINVTYEELLKAYLLTIDYRRLKSSEETVESNVDDIGILFRSLIEVYKQRGEVFISRSDKLNKIKSISCPKCRLSSISEYWDVKAKKRFEIMGKDFISIQDSLRSHINVHTNFICPVCNRASAGIEILLYQSNYENLERSVLNEL